MLSSVFLLCPSALLFNPTGVRSASQSARSSAITAVLSSGGQRMPSGLRIKDVVIGEGEEVRAGQRVTVHYTARISSTGERYAGTTQGTGGKPFTFKLGGGTVIPGWDEGMRSMRVGGKRTLEVPASLGYGQYGSVGASNVRIPPGAGLIIECELLGIATGRLDTEWTSRLFSTENLPLWGLLLVVWTFQLVAAAPEGSLPTEISNLAPLVLGSQFNRES